MFNYFRTFRVNFNGRNVEEGVNPGIITKNIQSITVHCPSAKRIAELLSAFVVGVDHATKDWVTALPYWRRALQPYTRGHRGHETRLVQPGVDSAPERVSGARHKGRRRERSGKSPLLTHP